MLGANPAPALDIERLAGAMAAAHGMPFAKLEPDSRAAMRLNASAALVWLGVDVRAMGRRDLAESLQGIAKALRDAAATMDRHREFADVDETFAEEVIAAMWARATQAETIARVLMGEVEEAGPASQAPAVDEEAI